MSEPIFAFTTRAVPIAEINIGDARIPVDPGRWDVSRWDATDAKWSGAEWLDIACDVRSFTSEYGRQRTTDRFVPGVSTVVVDNSTGWADPMATDPAILQMRPGREIRLGVQHAVLGTRWLFRGFIDSVVPTYEPVDVDTVTFQCLDVLGEVNRAKLVPLADPAYGGERADLRIGRILDLAAWDPDRRDLWGTSDTLIADELGGQVADLLGQAADSTGGVVFGDTAGIIGFRPRDWQTYVPDTPDDGTIGNIGEGAPGYTIPGVPQVDGYLSPTVGSVSTPDSADMTIDGRMRLTFGLRITTMGTGFPSLLTKSLGGFPGLELNVYAYQPSNNYVALSTANVGLTANVDVVMAQPFPVGAADHTLGIEFAPRSTALTSILDGVRTARIAGVPLGLPDTTAPVKIGGAAQLPGRVYWAQLDAINRAQLVLPGVAGNYLRVPDAANLDITDDIEIVARIAPTSWRPAAQMAVVGKYTSTGNQRSFNFALSTTGQLVLVLSTTGGDALQAVSSTGIPSAAAPTLWIKMTRLRSTGAVTFYTAPDAPNEPTSWTQLGTPITTAGTAAMFPSTAPVEIGSIATGTAQMFAGRIARAIVRPGIAAAAVLDVSENDAGRMVTSTTFVATSGQTVTVATTVPNLIVQAQPDRLVWRFDANDYPGTGTSYVDPRGRTWTLSAAGAITPKVPAVPPIVVPAVPADVCPTSWTRPFDRASIATRVIVGRSLDTAQVFDDLAAQDLYGIEPFERTDLLTELDSRIAEIGERFLETRGASTAPRVRSVAFDAATSIDALDLMTSVDVFKPSRYRCRLELARGIVFDEEMFATAVMHAVERNRWTLNLNLDAASPFAIAGARWDYGWWDQSAWADDTTGAFA